MPRFKVLLQGHDALMKDEDTGEERRAGFYVNCCVEAADHDSAGHAAVAELRRHPKYEALASWAADRGEAPPRIEVDSIERISFWRRAPRTGAFTGFVFYSEEEDCPAGGDN